MQQGTNDGGGEVRLPQEPIADYTSAPSYDDLRKAYEQMAARLSALESEYSLRIASTDDLERSLYFKEIAQRMRMRLWTATLAAAVVAVMMGFLFWSKYSASLWWLFFSPKVYSTVTIIAPTVSISTVTIALLWGAFRRFKDDDPEKFSGSLPVSSAYNAIAGNPPQ